MCLQQPMRVLRTEDSEVCVAEAGGRQVRVSLAALDPQGEPPGPGDWLLVLGGVAVGVLSAEEAAGLGQMVSQVIDGPAARADGEKGSASRWS